MSTTETAPHKKPSTAGPDIEAGEVDDSPDIGWARAIGSGIVVLLVCFLGGMEGANLFLTKALGLTRDARQWIATGLFLVVVIVLAWALRWLQARRLI